jgi:hypothetical protein
VRREEDISRWTAKAALILKVPHELSFQIRNYSCSAAFFVQQEDMNLAVFGVTHQNPTNNQSQPITTDVLIYQQPHF